MNPIEVSGITMAFFKAALAAGTTSTLTINSALDQNMYCINGKAYVKADASNITTPTTDAATGAAFVGIKANKGGVFVLGLDAAGALKCVQGEIVDLDASGDFIVAPEFPAIPDTVCPIGYYLIKAGSTADATTGWVFGTSNSASVTGITYTLVDCCALPNRPQIS